jgi:hypothetical protein
MPDLAIPKNLMFIGTPSDRSPHRIEDARRRSRDPLSALAVRRRADAKRERSRRREQASARMGSWKCARPSATRP